MEYPEEQFLHLLNLKQPRAFGILFREFYGAMLSFSLNYIPEKSIAEDIVQELFAKMWEKENKFISYQSLKTFLYRSVKNACFNHLKHEKVKQRFLIEEADKDGIVEELNDFEVMEEEMYRMLFRMVDALPKRCKEVFELHLQGKKNEEIACLLNISILTVKTQKSRAMQTLRDRMGPFFSLAVMLHVI